MHFTTSKVKALDTLDEYSCQHIHINSTYTISNDQINTSITCVLSHNRTKFSDIGIFVKIT